MKNSYQTIRYFLAGVVILLAGIVPAMSAEVPEHQDLVYSGPGTCLECHDKEAHEIFGSTHYQWKGDTPAMLNATGTLQGKHAGAVNTYCGNILGNWNGCSACHIGLGDEPAANVSAPQLENIDCLICHQEEYKRKRVAGVMVPDTEKMIIDMDEAVQTVHSPTRVTCLQCHAKAGGGDAVKRGDLALATGHTTDEDYDVHMATTGADLSCQACHKPENHRFPGKGSDIRPTDLDQVMECASAGCHDAKSHGGEELDRHIDRVACQTCHIPIYGKDAGDSAATEATELDRSWEAGSHHETPPYHPVLTKANNVIPVYRHWNGISDNYLLFDQILENPLTGTFETSVPVGSADDPYSKLYPFKYKTSDYPLRNESNQLIALDTSIFFATADPDAAVMSGLSNMGFNAADDYRWVTTDTYQLLNHQVGSHDDALRCKECHMTTSRMDLQGELGYAPLNPDTSNCSDGCHDAEKADEWTFGKLGDYKDGHKKHREEEVECSKCHLFSRAALPDADGDGFPDNQDNCTEVANVSQLDTDNDDIGNLCDCDFNQDNFCGGPDFTIFIGCFNALTNGDAKCEAADMNGDGFVGGPDFTRFIGGFNGAPGPAAP